MYDKIYKEIFLKNFVEKTKLREVDKHHSIWKAKIYQQKIYVMVYTDDIAEIITSEETNKKEYEARNEAELLHFREAETEKRIIANRLLLEQLRRYSKEAVFIER